MFNRENNDSDKEEQEEKERLKTARDERIQKNKEWRQRWVDCSCLNLNITSVHCVIITDIRCRRKGGKDGASTKEQLVVDKDARNEQIQNMLVCVNCGEIPEETVWTCTQGHLLCGDCVDLEMVEHNVLEDRKLGSESGIEDDLGRQEERESESCSNSDVGSYVRYLVL